MKKKKILIVGGTGFIGYHLAKKCLDKKFNVTSLSTKLPKKLRKIKKVKYLRCDISEKKKLKKSIRNDYDYVVNLGGHVNHKEKIKTYKSHFIGVKNLIDIFTNSDLKGFVQIGSGGEYGKLKSPHIESKSGNPKSTYYKSKLLSTNLIIKKFKKKKFPGVVLRLYQVYGPKQDFNRLIPIVIKNCINNKKFNCSEGIQFRDFIYVEDVVSAILLALEKKKAHGKIFNIGTSKRIKIKNLIDKINKQVGKGVPLYGKIKLRNDENIVSYPSITKVKRILNWQPKFHFNYGLKKTINEVKNRKKK